MLITRLTSCYNNVVLKHVYIVVFGDEQDACVHMGSRIRILRIFSFLKFNEFYEFFRLKKIRKKIVILQIIDA